MGGFRSVMNQMALAAGLGAGASALASGLPDFDWRVSVAMCAALAAGSAVWGMSRGLHRDQTMLTEAVRAIADGDLDTPIRDAQSEDFKPMAVALEEARATLRMRTAVLAQQRDALSTHLTNTEQRLRDPASERRRERLRQVPGLRASLAVAQRSLPVALLDLAPDHAILGLKDEDANRIVPGLPASIRLHTDAGEALAAELVATVPTGGRLLDLTEWMFRFQKSVSPSRLPLQLRRALELRGEARVKPTRGHPVHGVLIGVDGQYEAEVFDVSATGAGIRVPIDLRKVAAVQAELKLRLHLPSVGAVAVLAVVACNVRQEAESARIGLRFLTEQSGDETQKVQRWLDAVAAEDLHRHVATG